MTGRWEQLGNALRKLRKRKGLKLGRVAERAKIYEDESSVSRVERGDRRPTRTDLLCLITDGLECRDSMVVNEVLSLAEYDAVEADEIETYSIQINLSGPTSEKEVLNTIAQDHFKDHTGPEILAAIRNCEDKIRMRKADVNTYNTFALCCINAGHDGFCLRKRGEAFSHARSAISRAIELNSRSSAAYAIRGLINFSEYDWEKAEDDCKRSIDQNQRSVVVGNVCSPLKTGQRSSTLRSLFCFAFSL